jgi:hypothetical protein
MAGKKKYVFRVSYLVDVIQEEHEDGLTDWVAFRTAHQSVPSEARMVEVVTRHTMQIKEAVDVTPQPEPETLAWTPGPVRPEIVPPLTVDPEEVI